MLGYSSSTGHGVHGIGPGGIYSAGVRGDGGGFGEGVRGEGWRGVVGSAGDRLAGTAVIGEASGSVSTGVQGSGEYFGVLGRGGVGVFAEGAPAETVPSGSLSPMMATPMVAATGRGIALVAVGTSMLGGPVMISNTTLVGGDLLVGGRLSKGGGGFRVDHPLDPENRYLNHSFVESPEMKNVYDGVTELDKDGATWVDLHGWFEELNRDFCYQLAAIGRPAPELHVAQEVSENRFRIAGGEAGMKVSWQVTGIRRDRWAEATRLEVEEEKPEEEQGRYLHPELYGQPEDSAIGRGQLQESLRLLEEHDQQSRRIEEQEEPPQAI